MIHATLADPQWPANTSLNGASRRIQNGALWAQIRWLESPDSHPGRGVEALALRQQRALGRPRGSLGTLPLPCAPSFPGPTTYDPTLTGKTLAAAIVDEKPAMDASQAMLTGDQQCEKCLTSCQGPTTGALTNHCQNPPQALPL